MHPGSLVRPLRQAIRECAAVRAGAFDEGHLRVFHVFNSGNASRRSTLLSMSTSPTHQPLGVRVEQ